MKYILTLLAVFILSGCGGSSQPEPLSYPNWFLNPPQNTSESLYGVGEGVNISAAKAAALNAVAAGISVTISSELKQTESSSSVNGNENTYRSALSDLKAQVKAIEFNAYTVIKNQQLSNKFLVLIEVSRTQLYKDQKAKLERLSEDLKHKEAQFKKESYLKQAKLFDESVHEADKLSSLALLTQSINANFKPQAYLEQTTRFKANQRNALAHSKVKISTKGAGDYFKNALSEGFNEAGVVTVGSGANSTVLIDSSFQTDEIYGFRIAKARITLITKDNKNNDIASNTLQVSGKSRYDDETAKKAAAAAFMQKIKKEGIFSITGLTK